MRIQTQHCSKSLEIGSYFVNKRKEMWLQKKKQQNSQKCKTTFLISEPMFGGLPQLLAQLPFHSRLLHLKENTILKLSVAEPH
jgi:hypothetical protein